MAGTHVEHMICFILMGGTHVGLMFSTKQSCLLILLFRASIFNRYNFSSYPSRYNVSPHLEMNQHRVYDEHERAAIDIFKDKYMEATTSAGRKTSPSSKISRLYLTIGRAET